MANYRLFTILLSLSPINPLKISFKIGRLNDKDHTNLRKD